MPIDDMMLNPMLDPFRSMANECKEKGHSGEDMDRMMAALNRMEQLGQEMDDIGAYSGKITSEGLQLEFSNAYSEVLASAAKSEQSSPEDYDDAALLKTSVDALKDAIQRIREAKEQAITESEKHAKNKTEKEVAANEIEVLYKTDLLAKPIEDLIELGESGVNLPTFLRVQMEKGLDKAAEGSVVLKEGLEYAKGWSEASRVNPFDIKKANEKLEVFNDLASKAKFGVPDSLQVTLAHDKIDHTYIPDIAKWDGITDAWERIMNLMMSWTYAHLSFADKIFPWDMMDNPWPSIQQTKDCNPGEIKERIRIFKENFGLEFYDIFSHETFVWQVENHQIDESQIWYETLVNTVYPQCKPGNYLDQDTINEVERQWNENLMSNPERHKDADRFIAFFNSVFGEGAYYKKVGKKHEWGVRNAQPWNLSTFKIEK
ncbi:MAG: hypothetical protein HUJ25_05580 [Crocinitomicaceae bacterium]|nr:hypothetical protein [Crocinitomicaceae bacterium]